VTKLVAIDPSLVLFVTAVSLVLSAFGLSLVLKDYIASVLAGAIIRYVKRISLGRRVKILISPVIKGDIVSIGLFRTTLMEVGDGERLPSVQTGRILKVPNFMLINNPVLIYGETIIDEVVAYVSEPFPALDNLIQNMKEAITSQGHRVIEVGLCQKDENLVVHGIFESRTSEVADIRSSILKQFLQSQGKERNASR
jgi:small-conductance mechanosensitive channel